MGEYLAGMHDEVLQEVELLGRKPDFLTAAHDLAADEIDRKVARDKDGQLALRLKSMAQRRPQSRHQLIHAKGLADIIVGTEVERVVLRPRVVARGRN